MPTTMTRIQDERLTGAAALLVTIAAVAYANFGASGDNGGAGPFAVTVVVCAGLSALLFGRVVPGATEPAKAAAWLAALSVLTLVAFWSGLPIVLGAAAIAAGMRAQSTAGTAAAAVGALAATAGVVGCILG